MSYAESISLKLSNNTSTDQPIGLLGGTSSTYANANNTVLVEWNLSTETFAGNQVTLNTTTPITKELLGQNISGLVQTLNSMNVATFTFSGTTVYASALLDNSVEIADMIIDLADDTWTISGYSLSQTDPYSTGILGDWFISHDGNWFFYMNYSVNQLEKFAIITPFDMSTVSGSSSQVSPAVVSSFTFADNGNYLYALIGATYIRYPLVAPYDIGTTISDQSGSIGSGTPEFSPDGTKVYLTGGTAVLQYSLSPPFDVTGASFINTTDVLTMGITLPASTFLRSLTFSPDGTKLMIFVAKTTSSPFTSITYQCTCSTPFDPSTATYDGVSVDTTNVYRNYGGHFKTDGSLFINIYLQGFIGSSVIEEFRTYS